MRNPQGYAQWTGDRKDSKERDTITCGHCNCIVIVSLKEVNHGFCLMCMSHICLPCSNKLTCTPFEKQVEKAEAAERFRRSV